MSNTVDASALHFQKTAYSTKATLPAEQYRRPGVEKFANRRVFPVIDESQADRGTDDGPHEQRYPDHFDLRQEPAESTIIRFEGIDI